MEGIDGARMDVPVGSVVVWDNDTLAWLRVMLPQIPALTHLPAYDFLDASHPSTAPVPSHEEQNTVIKAYVTPSALEAARPFDGVFESETKLLLTTALSDTKLSKAVTDRDVEDLIDHVCDEHTRLARVEDVCAHFRAARRSRIDGDKKRKERELVSRLLALIRWGSGTMLLVPVCADSAAFAHRTWLLVYTCVHRHTLLALLSRCFTTKR